MCVYSYDLFIVTADILDDWLSDTILKVDRIIQAKISWNWPVVSEDKIFKIDYAGRTMADANTCKSHDPLGHMS
jgi:hypothetical protein